MSYANLLLYGASLPTYRSPRDGDGHTGGRKKEETIDADNPANRQRIQDILKSIG